VKRVLVDTLACAMGGYFSEPAKIARQLASTVKSDGEHGSRLLGTRDSSSPELAGFANSVMVRYPDYNDMSVGSHPSDSISLAVVPNLALGQTRVGELSMWKGMAGPHGTKAGIFAAQLAECGVTGPVEPFDGAEGLWARMLGHTVQWEEGWGEPFSIHETRFKFFPSQGGTQRPTGLAVELHSQVSPDDIISYPSGTL
jgi:2-methylcitrate dehydratase PrpD